jgi:hypothetical protein
VLTSAETSEYEFARDGQKVSLRHLSSGLNLDRGVTAKYLDVSDGMKSIQYDIGGKSASLSPASDIWKMTIAEDLPTEALFDIRGTSILELLQNERKPPRITTDTSDGIKEALLLVHGYTKNGWFELQMWLDPSHNYLPVRREVSPLRRGSEYVLNEVIEVSEFQKVSGPNGETLDFPRTYTRRWFSPRSDGRPLGYREDSVVIDQVAVHHSVPEATFNVTLPDDVMVYDRLHGRGWIKGDMARASEWVQNAANATAEKLDLPPVSTTSGSLGWLSAALIGAVMCALALVIWRGVRHARQSGKS